MNRYSDEEFRKLSTEEMNEEIARSYEEEQLIGKTVAICFFIGVALNALGLI